MTSHQTSIDEALAVWFQEITDLRDRQREVIERILAGRSTLMLMATGGGKSLCFQLPVLMRQGVGIIISPLIALMQDQTQKLSKRGVQVLSLGGLDARDAQESLRQFDWNSPGFIFTSPERAETDGYLEHLLRQNKSRVTLVAVDEAHCISQWGHDFRPPYKALPNFLDRAFGRGVWPPVLCLTATLDEKSRLEVLTDFRMAGTDVVASSQMLRSNLDLVFRCVADTDAKLVLLTDELNARRGEKLIVYAHLKQNKIAGTRALANRFAALGHRCAPYDADLVLDERERVLNGFGEGDIDVVFATGAFGMGVDIPDIRGVIHFLLPESLEQYYQEVGRAGRDGAPAFGLLLYAPKNAAVREDMINSARTTGDSVMETWSRLIEAGHGDVRSLSPNIEFQGRDDEYALVYAFQRAGALEIVARGPGRLASFEARGPAGAALLNRIASGTKIGNFAAAFRKLGLDPAEAYDELFRLYTRGEVRLVRSPDNVLQFRSRGLDAATADAIADQANEKIDKRLSDFRAFKDLVETVQDPAAALKARFAG